MVITSRANPLVKKILSLSDKKFRREYGEYIVEGTKPVAECISAGCDIVQIVCTPELENKFPRAVVVSEQLFPYLSTEKSPQGVLAVVRIPSTAVAKPSGDCLLLDQLQDPGNLGTILRTANAAGYEDIYLVNCTDPFSPKTVRASMSGIFFVKLHIGSLEEVSAALSDMTIITADMDGRDIFTYRCPDKVCLCIGNEGNGVSKQVLAMSSEKVRIPMRASCESLNAAVSAGIAMYALKNNKQRGAN